MTLRNALLLMLSGCAPYVTRAELLEAADPCAWSAVHADGWLSRAAEPCEAAWVFTGAESFDALGGSLARVGDVDGDARDDLALGAPAAASGRGAVHVFAASTLEQGRVLRVTDADYVVSGRSPGDLAGAAYTSLDDRDGVAGRELVVGAPGDDSSGAEAGLVVVLTTSDLRAHAIVETSDVPTRLVGGSRSRVGTTFGVITSTDGDGFEELVVGAPRSSVASAQGGTVFVAHSVTLPLGRETVLDVSVSGFPYITADAGFGEGLAVYDSDPTEPGITGLLVGAPRHPSYDPYLWNYADWGRAWLLSDAVSASPGRKLPVLEPFSAFAVNLRAETVFSRVEEEIRWRDDNAQIGQRVAVVPDMDGGGMDELVVAGVFDDVGDVVAFVVRGEELRNRIGDVFLLEDRAAIRIVSQRSGVPTTPAIAGVADVDGDGRGDLLIGDPFADVDDALDVGRVYVHTSTDLFGEIPVVQRVVDVEDAWWTLTGDTASGQLGAAVSAVGDLDGDGRQEVAIGAPGVDGAAGEDVGRVYVFSPR